MFCLSQASTAICPPMDEPSSSSSAQLGGRTIDRHNPIIRDGKRAVLCSSQPPISPVSYQQLQKLQKGSNPSHNIVTSSSSQKQHDQQKRKARAKLADFIKTGLSSPRNHVVTRKSSAKKGGDSAPGSSRYLLGDHSSDRHEAVSGLVAVEGDDKSSNCAAAIAKEEESACLVSKAKRSPLNQTVVLRVSLHCRGCEGKVRKHLSRMEGVRCFNIDFAAKKVTVEGDVTPVSVLASISKVKNAQFWTTGLASVTPALTKKQS